MKHGAVDPTQASSPTKKGPSITPRARTSKLCSMELGTRDSPQWCPPSQPLVTCWIRAWSFRGERPTGASPKLKQNPSFANLEHTHSESHWSTVNTMKDYIKLLVESYYE